MPPRTQESAIYGGPEDSLRAGAPSTQAFANAVSIVPAPPLKPKTMVRSHAIGLAVVAMLIGLGLGLGLGALLFS
jgi:hypothetical protein